MLLAFVLGLLMASQGSVSLRALERGAPRLWQGPALPELPSWMPSVRRALARTTDPQRRVVLQRLSDEGEPALQLTAAAWAVTPRVALARLVGDGQDRIDGHGGI